MEVKLLFVKLARLLQYAMSALNLKMVNTLNVQNAGRKRVLFLM